MNWNKKEHDFGIVKNGDTKYTTFKYLGNENTKNIAMEVSCGCTTGDWNHDTKTYNVGLNVVGQKISTITVHYPNGVDKEILVLKGQGQ